MPIELKNEINKNVTPIELKSEVRLLKEAVLVVQHITRIGTGSDGRFTCDTLLKCVHVVSLALVSRPSLFLPHKTLLFPLHTLSLKSF
jgi:hypothetical protein